MRLPERLTDKELNKISSLIYQRAGIVINSQKRDMVYNRLSRRLKESGHTSFTEYVKQLEANSDSREWQAFINALTTNLTSFFRESYHFPILAEHARNRKENYSVWSTAASTGEEACSIAITLDEVLGPSAGISRVWATDIDTDVLQKASEGIYKLADIENLSAAQKRHYFLRAADEHDERVKVRKALLSTIKYQHLNLLDANWDVPAPFDAIFCRNVMIYFDQKTQERLLQRFAKMLKPGGLLFAGHSEHFSNLQSPFRLRGQSVYYLTQEK